MKQLFTFLALCWLCATPARAQTLRPDALRQHLDHVFAPVGKAPAPHALSPCPA